jgi:2-C-methyl-D-erythritol 4-phosphate cytidylyltransferase
MDWGAVIVAAGRGTRFGRPKQFVELAGLPLAGWSLRTLASIEQIGEIVVVTESEWLAQAREVAARVAAQRTIRVVPGGADRRESVYRGLLELSGACEAVLIHDGARPLVRAQDVCGAMDEVRSGRASMLAEPVVDTIKLIEPGTMRVRSTPARAHVWTAQTPQCAMRADLMRAHQQQRENADEVTDDAMLLEAVGVEVVIVPATGANFKITHPEDIARAEVLMRERWTQVER